MGRIFDAIRRIVFLGLTSYFIIYCMVQLFKDPKIQIAIGIGCLFLEIEMVKQYAYGAAYKKRNNSGDDRTPSDIKLSRKYFRRFIIYLIFATLCGIAFFQTETSGNEEVAIINDKIHQINNEQFESIKRDVTYLEENKEKSKSLGINNKAFLKIDNMMNEKQNESKQILEAMKTNVVQEQKQKDVFVELSKLLWNFPIKVLKFILFSILMFYFYLGNMVNPWPIDLDQKRRKKRYKRMWLGNLKG